MSQEIGELTFLRQLAPRYGVPVPEFVEWPADRKTVQECLARWKSAVAKADILTGGRGKAGLVESVDSLSEAIRALKRLSAMEHRGRLARTSYLVQHVPADHEVYTAITYDSRYLSPVITLALRGGMDIESIPDSEKRTFPVDVYQGLDAYQAGELLETLQCPRPVISPLSRALVNLWDLFITSGMKMCEVNPWRITPDHQPVACDFKAVFDEANFKHRNLELELPEYPESVSEFQEEMERWNAQSYQGQAHVSDLNGSGVLPILFGGGASTIIVETLMQSGGDPMFLSDFGGNPPYERMRGTAAICFKHKLAQAGVLLILGGKANNTRIDVTFQALADALAEAAPLRTTELPVIVGRGGPRLVPGLLALQRCLEELGWPYAIFGHDTPITMVAQYAGQLYEYLKTHPAEKKNP
ncbi:MAG: carboxylate--amine ligase [Planctomycetota bacterium]|nr:carboxylate--amine ligase [Planctomycetota bacterium]